MGIYGDPWVETLIEGLRQEVAELKAENQRLRQEVEVLKSATKASQ